MESSLSQLHPEHARLLNEAKEELIIYVNKIFEKFFNTVSVEPGDSGHSSGDSSPQPVFNGGPGVDEFEEQAPLDLSFEPGKPRLDVKEEIDGQLMIEIGDCHDLFNVSTEPCQCDECLAQLLQSPERDVINGSSTQLGAQFEGESAFAQQNLTYQMPFEGSVLFRNPSNLIESKSLVPPAAQQQLGRQTSASETSNVSIASNASSSKRIKRKMPSDQSRTDASKSDRSNKKQRSTEGCFSESSSTKSDRSTRNRSSQSRKVSSKSSSDHSSSSSSQLSGRSDKRPEVKIKIKDKVSNDRRPSLDRRTSSSSSRSKAKVDSVSKRDVTKAKATDRKDDSSSRKETKSGWDRRGGRARGRRSSADHQRTSRRSPSPPPRSKAHNQVTGDKYRVINLKCRQCSETFEQTNPLEDHEFKQHQLKPIPCFYLGCDESFYIKVQLLDHVRECHANDEDWKCKHCGRVCQSEHQLSSHVVLVHRKGSFGCTFPGCGHSAPCRMDALRHYSNEHFDDSRPDTGVPVEGRS